MKLKAIVDKKEEIPAGLADYYTESDGKWTLDVEGSASEGELTKLRTAHERVKKERDDAKAAFAPFKDMNADEIHEKLDELTQLQELKDQGKLGGDEANEKLMEAKRDIAKKDREITKLTGERDTFKTSDAEKNTRIRKMTIENELAKVLPSSGIKDPAALRDIVLFAERELDITEDGKVTTKELEGVPLGLDVKGYVEHFKQLRPYLFPTTQGAGAGGGAGNGSGGGKNPFTAENWNMTEQGALVRSDAEKAKRMAEQAGTTIGGPMPAKKTATA